MAARLHRPQTQPGPAAHVQAHVGADSQQVVECPSAPLGGFPGGRGQGEGGPSEDLHASRYLHQGERGGGSTKHLPSLLQLCLKGHHVGRSSPVLFQVAGWGLAEKRNVKASASLVTLWTPPLRGNVSLENSKVSHTLHVASAYGKHTLSLSAALTHVDKVSGHGPSVAPGLPI